MMKVCLQCYEGTLVGFHLLCVYVCVCVGCVRQMWESTVPPVGMCFSLQCVVVSHESGFSQDSRGNVKLSLKQDTHTNTASFVPLLRNTVDRK